MAVKLANATYGCESVQYDTASMLDTSASMDPTGL